MSPAAGILLNFCCVAHCIVQHIFQKPKVRLTINFTVFITYNFFIFSKKTVNGFLKYSKYLQLFCETI